MLSSLHNKNVAQRLAKLEFKFMWLGRVGLGIMAPRHALHISRPLKPVASSAKGISGGGGSRPWQPGLLKLIIDKQSH